MSEIKGQLLGVVLVVGVFAAVAGVLVAAFKTAANGLSSKITDDTIPSSVAVLNTTDNLLRF